MAANALSPAPYNIEGYRREARRRLPRAIFDFVDGGAEDEVTLRANRSGFETLRLVPRMLTGGNEVDLSTTVGGQSLSMPVMLSPTGGAGFSHPDGELGAAVAANRQGIISIMSSAATYTVEEVASGSSPPPWFQLSLARGREFFLGMLDRAAAVGCPGLCLTVDSPVVGRRERDYANRLVIPPTLGARNFTDFARHPRWAAGVLHHRRVVVKAFADKPGKPTLRGFLGDAGRAASQFTRSLTSFSWDEVDDIRARWDGPLAIKGILAPADAVRAVELGVDVVIVSNHGGRQLDGALASIEALPAIVDAVGSDAEVVLDGGIRRGSDVVKALCLGARACSMGRPWLYSLATGGTTSVESMLAGFRKELEVALALLGVDSIHQLDRSYLAPAGVHAFGERIPLSDRVATGEEVERVG